MIKEFNVICDEGHAEKRIDVVLSSLGEISRSSIKNGLKELYVNNKSVKLSYKCKMGDKLKVLLEWPENDVLPENIPLNVIFEDENYMVINKPQGMVVHPSKGHYSGTLANALLGLNKNLSYDDERSGIVHRLDKDTSGLILVAKNKKSLEYLSDLFKKRQVYKVYKGILKGRVMPFKIRCTENIKRDPYSRKKMTVVTEGGKESESIFRVLKHSGPLTLVAIRIKTGRTHQIRVHAAHLGYPVLGDNTYSREDNRYPKSLLCLSATHLRFFDIFSNSMLDFKIGMPSRFREYLKL